MSLSQLSALKEHAKLPEQALEAACAIKGAAHEPLPRAAAADSNSAEKETPNA